jgi:hypothetical protein
MASPKVTLCPAGCGQCPDVEIAGDEVPIGETGNLAVLKKDEWNLLVDLIQSGQASWRRSDSAAGQPTTGGRVWLARFRANPPRQKLTVLDSEIKLANLIGSMKEAFKLLRSASVTPRATEQAPQTKTGTFPLTTLSISSGRGGKPTP